MKPYWFAFEPPIRYPYVFTHINNYKWLHRRLWKQAILDCGVEIFWRKTEYPPRFLDYYLHVAVQLAEIYGERLWVTIPDYCDDHKHVPNNVEKTLRNIEKFIDVEGVSWLPVIQARYLDIFSFYESCEKTREIIGDYPRVAIGTVCKTRRLSFIVECCKIARKFFPHSWIHAFGLTLHALPKVAVYIDSFDSSAYTFPRKSGHSCKNMKERIEYFHAYVRRIEEILGWRVGTRSPPPEAQTRAGG